MTETLKDKLFYGYFAMIIKVHGVIEAMAMWCEGCPCHDHIYMEEPQRQKRKRQKKTFRGSCIMRGKNLVGLVEGKLVTFFEQLASVTALDVALV